MPRASRLSVSLVRQIFRSRLTQWSIRAGWTALLLLHTLCTSFYSGVAWIYHLASTTKGLVWVASELKISVDLDKFPVVAGVYLAVAIVHGALGLRTIASSLVSRRFVFQPRRHKTVPQTNPR